MLGSRKSLIACRHMCLVDSIAAAVHGSSIAKTLL